MKSFLAGMFFYGLLLQVNFVFSQVSSLTENIEWCDGSITLRGDKKLTGYIQNNDKLGVINYKPDKNSQVSEIESFQEKSVLAMEYFDPQRTDYRRFYSFNCQYEETGFKGTLLFEVLKEYKKFAVLVRKTKVDLVGKVNSGMEGYSKGAGLITSQSEGYFCVGESGELEPFLIVENIEKDMIMVDRSKIKRKYFEEVIKKYIGENWDKIKAYARERKLSFSERDEVLALLMYLEKLEKEE